MNFNDKVRAMALRLIGNNNAVLATTEPKVYIALLTQGGTDDPVATVIENTLGGEVVWTRDDIGVYFGTLANAFPLNKTIVPNDLFTGVDGTVNCQISVRYSDADSILITVLEAGTANDIDGNLVGGDNKPYLLEIKVYP